MNTKIKAEEAQAMLDRDELNRVNKLTKGGLLSEPDRRRLKRIVSKAKRNAAVILPKARGREVASADPKTFEGTYAQRIRRRKVYQCRMMNMTVAEIEKELHIGDNTVMSDLKAIDAALQRTIDKGQADAILNERLSNLESLRDIALAGVRDNEGNVQIGYLNTLGKLEELITKLLQDAGVLRKATQRHELTGPDGMPLPAASGVPESIHVTIGAPGEEQRDKVVYLQPKTIEKR